MMLFDDRRLVYSFINEDSPMPMINDHEYQDLDLLERYTASFYRVSFTQPGNGFM